MTPNELREAGGHLLVRRAISRDDAISEAICDIAAGDRIHWTPDDWDAVLADLDACKLRVNDWLDLNV